MAARLLASSARVSLSSGTEFVSSAFTASALRCPHFAGRWCRLETMWRHEAHLTPACYDATEDVDSGCDVVSVVFRPPSWQAMTHRSGSTLRSHVTDRPISVMDSRKETLSFASSGTVGFDLEVAFLVQLTDYIQRRT